MNCLINKYLKELAKQILQNTFWIKEKALPKFCRTIAEVAEVLPKLKRKNKGKGKNALPLTSGLAR